MLLSDLVSCTEQIMKLHSLKNLEVQYYLYYLVFEDLKKIEEIISPGNFHFCFLSTQPGRIIEWFGLEGTLKII